MAPSLESLGIDKLNVEERLALVTAIWESIPSEPHLSLLADAQRAELEQRLVDHAANPEDVVPWEQIKADAQARFQK